MKTEALNDDFTFDRRTCRAGLPDVLL